MNGQVLDRWKGRRAPREGHGAPWFEEPEENLQRHEMVTSIMQHPPASDMLDNKGARSVLCTPDVTRCINMRNRGGKQWSEYLNPTDPLLQRSADAYARAVPHRDVLNLTKRVQKFDSKEPDTNITWGTLDRILTTQVDIQRASQLE